MRAALPVSMTAAAAGDGGPTSAAEAGTTVAGVLPRGLGMWWWRLMWGSVRGVHGFVGR